MLTCGNWVVGEVPDSTLHLGAKSGCCRKDRQLRPDWRGPKSSFLRPTLLQNIAYACSPILYQLPEIHAQLKFSAPLLDNGLIELYILTPTPRCSYRLCNSTEHRQKSFWYKVIVANQTSERPIMHRADTQELGDTHDLDCPLAQDKTDSQPASEDVGLSRSYHRTLSIPVIIRCTAKANEPSMPGRACTAASSGQPSW